MARVLLNAPLVSRLTAALLAMVLLSGCTSVFFYPTSERYITPNQLQLEFEEILLPTPDGETLYGWWLPAQGDPQGTVYFLHGNAQNISAHLVNVSWLPPRGYNVFLLDYRGYGFSTGEPDLEGVLIDSRVGLEWVLERQPAQPVFVLGQSLGGSLAILTLADYQGERQPRALIIDGAFAGFRQIAREKLDQSWLTWPLQVPLSLLIPDDREPVDAIGELEVPLLVIHSQADGIVPFHHGQALYQAAPEPKQFLPTATPHAATFLVDQFQDVMVAFLERYAAGDEPEQPR